MTLLIALLVAALPADTLDLAQCYAEAEAHHPLRPTLEVEDDIRALNLANLTARFRPAVALTGQAVKERMALAKELPAILG